MTTNANAAAGSVTWTQLGASTFTGLSISSLVPTGVLDPLTGKQVLLAATQTDPAGGTDYTAGKSTGLYRSADGGQTWTNISGVAPTGGSGVALPAGDVTAMVADNFNPSKPVFFAAVTGQGIYSSADNGLTWSVTAGNAALGTLASPGRIRLSVHTDATNDVLYAALSDDAKLTSIFRTTNRGATWKSIGLPPVNINGGAQASANLALVADPTDPTVLYISGDTSPKGTHYRGVYNAATGKAVWTNIEGTGGKTTTPHSDSRAMAFDKNGNLIETDDGGLFRLNAPTTSATRTWVSLAGNLAITELNSVSYDSVTHTLFGGAQDNGSPTQTFSGNTTVYSDSSSGDGQLSQADTQSMPGFSIRYTEAQSGNVYRTIYNGSGKPINGVARSAGTILKFTVATTGKALSAVDKTLPFTLPFVLNTVDPTRMLLGTDYLYESADGGANVTSLGGLVNGSPQGDVGVVSALAYGGRINGVANADVAYVGTSGAQVDGTVVPNLLLRATANGVFNPIVSYKGASPMSIVLDPNDWRIAYVLDANGQVWRSSNASDPKTPFVNITANLGSSLTNLQTISLFSTGTTSPPVLFAGGLGGVAATTDPTAATVTWAKFGTLPNVMVTGLTYDATDNVLAASTFGRGFFVINGLTDSLGHPSPVVGPGTLATSFTAGGSPVAIVATGLTVTDSSSTTISGATIILKNPMDGASEILAVNTAGTAITASIYDPKSGQLVLTGTDSLANYQAVLQSATYADTATSPNSMTRIITLVVNDGLASSVRATTTVAIAGVSGDPSATGSNTAAGFLAGSNGVKVTPGIVVTDSESSTLVSATFTLTNPLDGSGESLSVDTTGTNIVASYDPDTSVLTLEGTDTLANYQQVFDSLSYDNTAVEPSLDPRLIDLEINDGTKKILVDSYEVDLTPVNHAPVLDPAATFDLDSQNEDSSNIPGTFVTDLLNNANTGDAYTDIDPGDPRGIAVIGVDDTNGTWQYSLDAGQTYQAFDGASVTTAYLLSDDDQTLVRFVPNAGFTGEDSGLTFRGWDQSAGLSYAQNLDGTDGSIVDTSVNGGSTPYSSDTANATAVVVSVNQAPSFTEAPSLTVATISGAQTIAGFATNISAGGASESGQTLNFVVTDNNNAFFTVQPAISPNGTLTFTAAPGAQGTAVVTVLLHDNGGTANGGVDTSAAQTFTITLSPTTTTPVNQAPSFTEGPSVTVNSASGAQSIAGFATNILAGPASESAQTVSFLVANNNNALFAVQPAISPTGTLTFTPAAGAQGTVLVTVVLFDNGGTANGGVANSTVQLFMITLNTPPPVGPTPISPAVEAGQVAFVTDLYREILGRSADLFGLSGWVASLNSGTAPSQVVADFFGSAERKSLQAHHQATSITPAAALADATQTQAIFEVSKQLSTYAPSVALVVTLYEETLGRTPDLAGLDHFLALLNTGSSPSSVAGQIYNSPEAKTLRAGHKAPKIAASKALSDAGNSAKHAILIGQSTPAGLLG